MTRDELEAAGLIRRSTSARTRSSASVKQIRRHPELGFKEVKTARLVEETFKQARADPADGSRR